MIYFIKNNIIFADLQKSAMSHKNITKQDLYAGFLIYTEKKKTQKKQLNLARQVVAFSRVKSLSCWQLSDCVQVSLSSGFTQCICCSGLARTSGSFTGLSSLIHTQMLAVSLPLAPIFLRACV